MQYLYGSMLHRRTVAGGGSASGAQLLDGDYSDAQIDPANASCGLTVGNSGAATATGESPYTWLLSGVNSDYEIRADVTSGSLSSGTTGSWLVLSTSRSWAVTRTVIGTKTATMAVQIRRVSDSVVLTTATITITATVDF